MKMVHLDNFGNSIQVFNSLDLNDDLKNHSMDVAKIAWTNLGKPDNLTEKDLLYISVALFHDLYEDTEYRFDSSADRKFIDAIELLTRDRSVPYLEYIQKIKDSGNEIAKFVKLCDLEDHLSKKSTLKPSLEERYLKALDILNA